MSISIKDLLKSTYGGRRFAQILATFIVVVGQSSLADAARLDDMAEQPAATDVVVTGQAALTPLGHARFCVRHPDQCQSALPERSAEPHDTAKAVNETTTSALGPVVRTAPTTRGPCFIEDGRCRQTQRWFSATMNREAFPSLALWSAPDIRLPRSLLSQASRCALLNDNCRPLAAFLKVKTTPSIESELQTLNEVNRLVNRSIRPLSDQPGLINDIWTIWPAAGDCDDYAVTKRAELIKRGWSPASLLLAQVVAGGEQHLVLVARTSAGDRVLDNLTPDLLKPSEARLRWIAVQSSADPSQWKEARVARTPAPGIAEKPVRVRIASRSSLR